MRRVEESDGIWVEMKNGAGLCIYCRETSGGEGVVAVLRCVQDQGVV